VLMLAAASDDDGKDGGMQKRRSPPSRTKAKDMNLDQLRRELADVHETIVPDTERRQELVSRLQALRDPRSAAGGGGGGGGGREVTEGEREEGSRKGGRRTPIRLVRGSSSRTITRGSCRASWERRSSRPCLTP